MGAVLSCGGGGVALGIEKICSKQSRLSVVLMVLFSTNTSDFRTFLEMFSTLVEFLFRV